MGGGNVYLPKIDFEISKYGLLISGPINILAFHIWELQSFYDQRELNRSLLLDLVAVFPIASRYTQI